MLDAEFDSILSAAQAGSDRAWSALYAELAGPVLGYLRRGGARDAEDLLGEVFVHLARSIGSFSGSQAGFRSWVFTVAHHRLIDERRRNRRKPLDLVDSLERVETASADDPAREALETISSDRVTALLSGLAPAQRDVLLLRIVGGLTVPEIAEAVGRSVGAVKALQRRGLEAIRRHLERSGVPL